MSDRPIIDCPIHGSKESSYTQPTRCASCNTLETIAYTVWNQTYTASLEGTIKIHIPEKAVQLATQAADVAARAVLEAGIRGAATRMHPSLLLTGPHYGLSLPPMARPRSQ
jgi:hypothetical protein